MESPKLFHIGQCVRIIDIKRVIPPEDIKRSPDNTGVIDATLTIAPNYYEVRLDASMNRCIVHASNLEVLPQ